MPHLVENILEGKQFRSVNQSFMVYFLFFDNYLLLFSRRFDPSSEIVFISLNFRNLSEQGLSFLWGLAGPSSDYINFFCVLLLFQSHKCWLWADKICDQPSFNGLQIFFLFHIDSLFCLNTF